MRSVSPCVVALACALGAVAVVPASAGAYQAHRDLSYDLGSPPPDPSSNALDLYVPDGAQAGDGRPIVVYVHGGAWAIGDKSQRVVDKAPLFTGVGMLFASVNYRLSPEEFDPSAPDPNRVMFPDYPEDVAEALAWITRNAKAYGGDPKRVILLGHSAGAHLVSLVSTEPSYLARWGLEPWRIAGTVSLDTGAFDVAGRIDELGPQGRSIYFNAFGTPAENAAGDLWRRASPITWADPDDPRHLLVTQSGSAARMSENASMATALGQDPAGVVAVPYDHAQINIAVGSTDDPAGETAAIMDFIDRSLRAAEPLVTLLKRHPPRRVRTEAKRTKVTFEFKARGERRASFKCRLDSGRWRSCKSPKRYRLARGKHRFRVRAIAPNGRPGEVRSFRLKVKRASRRG